MKETRDTTGFNLVSLLLVSIGPALVYARTLAPGLTWANNGSDGGDLITAVATAGVPHPTGYPTYILLVSIVQALPIGDLAFSANVFSAWVAVATLVVLYGVISTILHTIPTCLSPRFLHASAIIATSVLAFSPLFWSQAVIAEVYTLNALFVALLIRFTLHALLHAPRIATWTHRSHALVAGLALGNHLTIIFPIAGWLIVSSLHAIARSRDEQWSSVERITPKTDRQFDNLFGLCPVCALVASVRESTSVPERGSTRMVQHWWGSLLWCGVGSLVYLLLPLRAAAHPPVNWGNAATWGGFWWLVTAQPYSSLLFGVPLAHLGGRVAAWAAILMQNIGIAGITIAFIGLLYAYHLLPWPTRRIVWLSVMLACVYSVFALAYNTTDSHAYLIPVIMMCAIWIGAGCLVVLDAIQQWSKSMTIPLGIVLICSLVWHIPTTYHAVDARHDDRAMAYAIAVLETVPPDAIVITGGDRDSFALWYYHYARGWRRDIAVVVEPMLVFTWYREHMQVVYPMIDMERLTEAIRAGAPAQFDARHLCRTLLDEHEVVQCRDTASGIVRESTSVPERGSTSYDRLFLPRKW